MPRNLFGSFDDDFETNPIVKATGAVAKQIAKTTVKQVQKTAQTVKTQVKGTKTTGSTSQSATDDTTKQILEAADTSTANVDPVAQVRKSLTAPVYFHPTFEKNKKPNTTDPNAPGYTPVGRTQEEQEEIQEVRRQLYHHRQDYYDQTIGRVSDIEGDQRRKRFQREQDDMRKKQEEEEEEMRKKQEEEQKKQQQLAMPKGKNSRNKMGKPIAVKRAQTKTETGKMTG